MFGSAIPACGAAAGPGKGYPLNFWRANQFATGAVTLMDDRGFSNYHGLQVEFRQRNWHGVSLNANYTLSKTMAIATQGGDFTAAYTEFSNRDLMLSYAPAITDRRHVLHVSGTYDLPFGNGQAVAERWNTREDRGWLDGLHDRHVPERHPLPDCEGTTTPSTTCATAA